jgi:hypothetical protein
MDDIVLQALVKWPNVPHCYGWLGLDARGNWYMRDDAAQAAGPFASGRSGAKGSRLQHEKLIEFIQRNYACDEHGQWFFQNGPQRVYVELEATPWIWRIGTNHSITNQCATASQYRAAFVDEQGWLYLETDTGFGLVHTLDMEHAANAIEQGLWKVADVEREELATRFHYQTSPQQEKSRQSRRL